ncbi:hypothetical protein [Adhaeribacter aquaticus]|uniref:hypothetical protein n=1 Tax=Adhaeribacter aquaticus TaxID=299567 RepID=UPI00040EA35F|nr:hypothetical protein [Adhaeribacter aquaticus]
MKASEAKILASKALEKTRLVEQQQLNGIYEDIQIAADKGELAITIDRLTSWQVAELKGSGYSVKSRSSGYNESEYVIDWSNPDAPTSKDVTDYYNK